MIIDVGLLFALTSLLSFSFSELVTKLALNHNSKWKVLFLAQLFGGAVILVLTFLSGEWIKISASGWWWLLGLACANFLGMFTYYKAMEAKGVALTSSIANSWAIIPIVLGIMVYGEKISWIQWISIAFILVGVVTIIFKKGEHFSVDRYLLFAVISMMIWGLYFFVVKVPLLLMGAFVVASVSKIITSSLTVPVIISKKINVMNTTQKALWFILLVGFLDGVGFLTYNFAILNSPISLVAPIITAVPVISVMLGVFVLKEKLTSLQKMGIGAALVGLILITV